MLHKQDSMRWGRALCGATNVRYAKSWDDVTCDTCKSKRVGRKNHMENRQYKNAIDEVFIDSSDDEIDLNLIGVEE